MTLILPLPPSLNHYWRSIGRGRVLVSAEGRLFRQRCKLLAIGQKARYLTGDVEVRGTVYFKDRRRDLDNALKALLDALGDGVCYANDRQVARIDIRRAIDKDNPRVEIEITASKRVEETWKHV